MPVSAANIETAFSDLFLSNFPILQTRLDASSANLMTEVSPLVAFQSSQHGQKTAEEGTWEVQLQALAGGDFSAFWRLWEEHQPYLYRVCLQHLGGVQEDAEDALSRLLIKLWDLLPRHAGSIKNLRAWLTRITYNLCIDIHRERKQTRNTKSIDDLTAAEGDALLRLIESPEEAALRQEIQGYLYHGVNDLTPKLRIPFLLHFLDDVPYSEIAAQLAISPENARKRGQLARGVLRNRLKNYVSGAEGPAYQDVSGDFDSFLEPALAKSTSDSPGKKGRTPTVALRLVNVVLNSGVERSFCVPLDHKPLKLHPKIDSVTRYTSDHPTGWKKRLELAQLLYEAGQWQQAVEEYRRVLEKQPRLIHVYLDLGNVLDLMERKSDSIATYQKALTIVEEPATRHHISGLLETRRGNHQKAISEFQEAAQIEPLHAAHWHHLAVVYLLEDSSLEALGCFEESLKIDPHDVAALTHLPYLLRDLGRLLEAERYLETALKLHPENVLSMKCLADLRSERRWVFGQEGKKTLALIRDATRLAEGSPEIQHSLATYHLCCGDWDEGIAVLRTFTEEHPSSPEGWAYYAKVLFQTGDLESAAAAVKRARWLDLSAWEVNVAACEILSWQGATPELLQLLEEMLERFPRRWKAWTKVGLAWLTALKDPERAAAISSRGPQLQPRLADTWFQHSKLLALAGKYHEAIICAEVGWQRLAEDEDGSQSVPAAIGLAENHILVEEVGSEQAWLHEAAKRLPGFVTLNPAEGSYWQGRSFELKGEKPAALQSYVEALRHNLFYPLRREAAEAVDRLATPLSKRARLFPVR
jgi:RNA polymerase sigma factor (sigma-70 family)